MPEAPHPVPELRTRRAALAALPATLNRERRTVEAVAATNAPIRMGGPNPAGGFEPWHEVLDLAGADLSRFIGGPLLLDHMPTTDRTVGVIEAAEVRGNQLIVRVRFATTPKADEALTQIAEGVLSGFSVGYRVSRYEAGAERGTWIARAWQPLELSLTPIPADAAARVRSAGSETLAPEERGTMPDHNTPAPPAPEVLAERTRIASLEPVAQAARERGMLDIHVNALKGRAIEEGLDGNGFKALLFDAEMKGRAFDQQARAEQAATPGFQPRPVSQFGTSYDDPAVQNARRAGAIMARALGIKPADDSREFMQATLADHAREILAAAGVKVNRYESDDAVMRRALSTSDFTGLLQSSAERSLQQLIAADTPVRSLCRPRQVRDFRQIEALTFSGPGSLAVVEEGGEVTHAPPAERREVGRVKTYARQIQLTREALVNDDLGAFADPLRLFASAVAETEGAAFVALFATNGGGWGPNMSDGTALFHSTHGNVASGTMSTTGIAAARLVMRAQQLPGGGLARVTPRHILVGPAGETAAEQALNQTAIATTEGDRPVFGGRLQLHVEPRLSGAPWFLAADPSEAAVFEFVTLAGTNGVPTVESFDAGPNLLGVSMRVVHDFAVLPAGWIGWVRATGA